MASQQQIKRRIGSVTSTRQITKAMQLVAASKLRRAQEAALGPREYSRVARQILTHLRRVAGSNASPLFTERPAVRNRLYLVISSDRSLAGAYNANVIRRIFNDVRHDQRDGVGSEIIAIGRQIATAASRVRGLKVSGVYTNFGDRPTANQLRPVLNTAVEMFMNEQVDEVVLVYTDFISTVSQKVASQRLLPAGFETVENDELAAATIEPSVEELVAGATSRLLEAQLYQAYLESAASEHAMRMLAMQNATDNASDIIDDLTLAFNNARQAAITQELAEISGGVEALNS